MDRQRYFQGLDDFFRMLEENAYKIQYRVMLARYRGRTVCPECEGSRMKRRTLCTGSGKHIGELLDMPVDQLQAFSGFHATDVTEERSHEEFYEVNGRPGYMPSISTGLSDPEPMFKYIVRRRDPTHQPDQNIREAT